MKQMELLAPAGSLEAFEAAVESGADAVYLGGSKFNARAYADNLNEDMLRKAVEFAHVRGVKVYVTVNILILQTELEEVLKYIGQLYAIDVDAVIVQDIGLAMLIRQTFPDFEVHCSTQMAIHNTDGAKLLSELGIERVVLARELSLVEIDEIAEQADIEAEIFVHGALCVCYSGQCYMSSLIGGRSGNRGKCAQPCRRKYRLAEVRDGQEGYLISTRDLSTYENLYKIAASKALSLKIEGRMKRPEYVATIVHHYKKAMDCIRDGGSNCISQAADYELRIAFNREFTEGYLFGKRNQDIVSIERPDNRGIYIGKVLSQKGNMAELQLEENFLSDGDGVEIIDSKGKSFGFTVSGIKKNNETVKVAYEGDRIRVFVTERVTPGSAVNKTMDSSLFQKAREEYAYKNKRKIALTAEFNGIINQAPVLKISDSDDHTVTITADELVQTAQKLAMTDDKIREQLSKTTDTPYYFKDIKIHIDEGCYLSVKAINNLRREALEQLSAKRKVTHIRDIRPVAITEEAAHYTKAEQILQKNDPIELIAGVRSEEAGIHALRAGADSIYLLGDYNYQQNASVLESLAKLCQTQGKELFYVLPQITRNRETEKIEELLRELFDKGIPLGLCLSNLSHLQLAKRLDNKYNRGNFTLNVINSASAGFLDQHCIKSLCVSPELNLSQIRALREAANMELEAMVYGYLPAMVTEYCPATAGKGCKTCEGSCGKSYGIVDERSKLFPVIGMGNCRNMILNSDVLCVYDNLANIADSGVSKMRMDFYLEAPDQVYEIVKAYKEKLENTRAKFIHPIIEDIKNNGYTKGHYFRGIE